MTNLINTNLPKKLFDNEFLNHCKSFDQYKFDKSDNVILLYHEININGRRSDTITNGMAWALEKGCSLSPSVSPTPPHTLSLT